MNYTKGEWKASCLGSEGYNIVLNQTAMERKLRGFGTICRTVYGKDWNEERANAQLISAAPDMYEALKEAYNYIRPDQLSLFCEPGVTVEQKIQQALAKAEGGK